MSGLLRGDLAALPGYVPGRTVAGAIKLASNEVPYGPLPGVPEAMVAAVRNTHRYPDMGVVALREALGRRLGVSPERIVTGCGSVALAEHLVKASCRAGDEVIYAWRSFEAYPIIVTATGAVSAQVPNTTTHGHDLTAMAAAITPRTRMILICNPNNPTGTAVRRPELDKFLAAVPDDVLVVLDEAYREFVTDPEVPDGLDYGDRQNVVVLRTFSKAWGLAGLRVGYLVAHPAVAQIVAKLVTPFSVSVMAQAAALAALRAETEMVRRVALVTAERERVLRAVRELVPAIPASQANFVWLPLGAAAGELAATCESHRVIVRSFAGDGVRVTIGTPQENDAFLAALRDYAPTSSIGFGA